MGEGLLLLRFGCKTASKTIIFPDLAMTAMRDRPRNDQLSVLLEYTC
jgi:hypothetical protein